jgi:MoaA/NifB/PqqE/SkfB family radical SAM enzyme
MHDAPSPTETIILDLIADRHHARRKAKPVLRHVALEVTSRCNLSCRHCYAHAGPDRGRDDLNLAELLGLAFSLRRDFGKRVAIDILGGEPMVRPDLLPFLRFLSTLGFRPGLATNGTLLDPTTVWRLSRYLGALCVSLDGVRRTHGLLRGHRDVRSLVRAIRHAVQSPIPYVEVKTAVWKANLNDLPILHRIVKKLRVDAWHLFPIEAMGRGENIEPALLDRADYRRLVGFYEEVRHDPDLRVRFGELSDFQRRWKADVAERFSRCQAGISSLTVLANGEVVACMHERGPSQGNVRRTSLREIWEHGFAVNRAPDWTRCGIHRFGTNHGRS